MAGRRAYCDYHHDYTPIDRYVWLNTEDIILKPIKIDQLDLVKRTFRQFGLKEPSDFPDMHFVDGYGKAPEDQVFEREVTPQGIKDLEKSVRNEIKGEKRNKDRGSARRELLVVERFWEHLASEPEKYEKEIEWLNLMWYYRLLGKFFFCNGKVTYIPGSLWFFLNYWTLNANALPDYRDRDRRWAVALKYSELTTETFKTIDPETGYPVPNEIGEYEMIDIGKRTLFGCNFPKARRVGDTSRIEAEVCEFSTRTISAKCGIQGKDDGNATTVFQEHLVYPFVKLPVFWKPVWDSAGGLAPKSVLMFDNIDDITFGLHSFIDFATSSDKAKYDGKYLNRFHYDEAGKANRSDCNDVNDVVKYCLSLGAGSEIHGLQAITTTCDEIDEASAGENYKRLCDRSMFHIRDANGQTDSGMMNVFFKAEDGLAGYIGRYGESIIENPTPEQVRYIGRSYGSRDFINKKIAEFRRAHNWEALAMFRRQHPQCYQDCFTPPPAAQTFNRDKIEQQISFLTIHPEFAAVRGNFEWMDFQDKTVRWVDDPDNGRFYKSKNYLENEINQKVYRDGVFWPRNMTKSIMSPDTFSANKPAGRKSNGGNVVRLLRDKLIDFDNRPLEDWETDRVVVTYSFRPASVDLYCEDMLKCSIYTQSMVFPEKNVRNVEQYFERMGFKGYLLYDMNKNTGKFADSAGWWNNKGNVETAMLDLAKIIENDCSRIYHVDLLNEYLRFAGISYLTDNDLIAAELGTVIGVKNPFYGSQRIFGQSINAANMVPGYSE